MKYIAVWVNFYLNPLGNFIPDYNDLVSHNQWKKALEALLSRNNFPEFTGRLCPALCEDACVKSLSGKGNSNRLTELAIIEKNRRTFNPA